MGWDAFSTAPMSKGRKFQLKHKKHRDIFEAVSKHVQDKTGSVDGYLSDGSLDVSTCRNMLQKATGEGCYTDWTPDKARQVFIKADWNFKYSKEDAWAYWSAKLWLETIVQLNLGVHFSY